MESSLHRTLKLQYAGGREAETEVTVGGYRIDARRGGRLFEIQCASLSAIKAKSRRLLAAGHDLTIVKPITRRTTIRRLARRRGKVVSSRRSPKVGAVHAVFDDLVFLHDVFPHPRLTIELPIVDVVQTRYPATRRCGRTARRRGYQVADVELSAVVEVRRLIRRDDPWDLIDAPPVGQSFGTRRLGRYLGCDRDAARRIVYFLAGCGAIERLGRTAEGNQFRRVA